MILSGNPARIPDLGFTHAGRFHADDVFSTALLRMLHPDIRIYRGFTVPIGFSGIVYDIGNSKFDHHAKERELRPNGVPYAAFGLLWREYGHYFLSPEGAAQFDEKFIQPMDLDDNSGTGHLLGVLIGAYNPVWDDPNPDSDAAFFEAVDVAQSLLAHRLEGLAAVERGKAKVEECLATMRDNIVVLPVYVPWKPVLVDSPAEFVIFPSARGGYSLQCIPREFSGKTGDKVPLPSSWRGQPVDDLRRISGVADAKFCHASGFMATTETLDGAMQMARNAQQEYKRRKAQGEADRKAHAEKVRLEQHAL